jgi:hypothetical protein
LLAHVLKDEIELARGILLRARGDADAAGLGQGFQTRRDVHAVTEDVLDDDIAHAGADTELDAPVGRNTSIPFDHAGLHLGHTAQRIHDTAELNEQPVTCRLDEVRLYLAGALGLSGNLDEAKAALSQALKLKPEVKSLARFHASRPWITNPVGRSLRRQ